MAYFNRTEIGLKDTTVSVSVSNNPTAKLMYYLNCVCSVLNMDDNRNYTRLRDHARHYLLSPEDKNTLIRLCVLFNPILLLDKCFFLSPDLSRDMSNKFYEIETVKNDLLVAGNVLIGGRQRRVTMIMTFNTGWIERYWTQPIEDLQEERRQETLRQEQLKEERLRKERQEKIEEEKLRKERLRQERLLEDRRRYDSEWLSQEWLREERLRQERREAMRRKQKSSTCNIL